MQETEKQTILDVVQNSFNEAEFKLFPTSFRYLEEFFC